MKEENQNNYNVKYVVEKKDSKGIKIIGIACLMILSGFAGGLFSNYLSKKENISSKEPTQNVVTTYNIETVENPVVAVAEKLSSSVVGIKVTYMSQNFWGLLSEAEGEGSGIVYSQDGYIVTNYHVIENAIKSSNAKIYVLLANDEKEYEATIVGHDSLTDLAVIKIEATGLTAAEFGDSEALKVGQLAVAIGNPLGQEFAGTVTGGYISGLNRSITVDSTVYNLIQTDAAINSGNSGGPLVDISGRVIGINTAKISATGVEGIGFAIPINDVLPIVEELIENKTIVRPFIGIGGIALDEDLANRNNLVEGIYIQEITKDSPAQIAGLKQGDIIVEANGTKVVSVNELNVIKNKLKVGDKIDLKVYRNKEYINVKVTLASTSDFE
ncbi:MAG: trypsin-like peptidase domain-containing protein [Clostridia bacterium]|nr:trypsin-like peptidase domain-containing protein [Clostridia bacterium]